MVVHTLYPLTSQPRARPEAEILEKYRYCTDHLAFEIERDEPMLL